MGAENVPDVPRVLEEPPRSVGDVQQDYPLLLDWFYRAYQVIVESVAYVDAVRKELVDENTANIAPFLAMASGEVTVSNTDTSATVTFETEQKDAEYVIMLQGKSFTGSPTNASLVVSSKTYGTTSFSFTVATAPGAGTSVTFDWQLVRNT